MPPSIVVIYLYLSIYPVRDNTVSNCTWVTTMTHANPLTTDKIILFGDSLTEQSWNQEFGFNLAPALQHEYFRKLQVLTHGYGGYNSEHARHILDPMLDAETAGGSRIRLLVIFFGTNDAVEVVNTRQHVPIYRYAENLRVLTEKALSRSICVVLVGPAPVGENTTDRSSEITRQYADAAKGVAEEQQVPFIDLWTAFYESFRSSPGKDCLGEHCSKVEEASQGGNKGKNMSNLFSPDGVHFSGQGYRIFYELLLHTIRKSYPALRTESLPSVLPHIFNVDLDHLPESLWGPGPAGTD
jgi:lysophospholipase L1-like esterase